MAVKPTNLAEWATGGGAPIAEPLLAEKQAGWAVAFKPPAQWFNWWQKLVHQWVVWLDAFESDPHTWSALQSFNNATFSGPLTTNSAFAANGTATFSGASAFNDTISLNPTGFTAAMALATVAAGRKLLLRVPVSGTVAMRIYASPETGGAAGGFGAGLEFVYNAEWNGSVWTRDDVTKQAGRVVIGQGIQVSQPGTGAAWSPQVMFGGYDAALFPAGVNSGYTEFDMLVFNPSGQLVVAAEQTQRAWDNLTLSANMTPTVLTPRLFRDTNGMVHLSGLATTNTTVAVGAQIATIYAPQLPDRETFFFVPARIVSSGLVAPCTIKITTAGIISIEATSLTSGVEVYFEGLTFRGA
jgi:hypothetical protein